jgi:hypothetical protein
MELEDYKKKRQEYSLAVQNANLLRGPLNALMDTHKAEKWKTSCMRANKHRRYIVMGMALIREKYYGRLRMEKFKKDFELLIPIMEVFKAAGFNTWIVGDCIYKTSTNKACSEYSLVTDAPLEKINELHPSTELKVGTRTYKVEVLPLNGFSIQEFSNKQSFTILACVLDNEFKFPFEEAQQHYRDIVGRKPLRCPIKPSETIKSNPSTILEAYILVGSRDLVISPELREAIRLNATLLKTVSVKDDFLSILKLTNCASIIRQMMADGVLTQIVPELAIQVGWDQEHTLFPTPLWEHSLAVLAKAEEVKGSAFTRLAALLNGIGKPYCYQNVRQCPDCNTKFYVARKDKPPIQCYVCSHRTTETGAWKHLGKSYNGLMQTNCDMVKKIVDRLGFNEEEKTFVVTLVSGYEFYDSVPDWSEITARKMVSKIGLRLLEVVDLKDRIILMLFWR